MHQPDERDGVPTAGKTKTRFEKNQLGMLTGTIAKHGEAARYRTDFGSGCIAPCQDHYSYERGAGVVSAEFPLGKRAFPDTRAHEL